MKIVINSKFFNQYSPEKLGEKAIELGFDGIDICIRPGHPINENNVTNSLPKAAKIWRKQGLVCPLATAPVSMTDPSTIEVERFYAACSEAGIPRLKIGFWKFHGKKDYWQILADARIKLEKFALLTEKFGVQTCYQIHSGPCIGSNCAGLMHLIHGFNPTQIGAYPDLGHLVLDGEDWEMGLSMMGNYLSVIGIKDAIYVQQSKGKIPNFQPCFVKMGEGCIDWLRCFELLKKIGFDGPLTVHTEYQFDEKIIRKIGYSDTFPSNLELWAKEDVLYIRELLKKVKDL